MRTRVGAAALDEGKQLHAHIKGQALDIVAWTAMIAGYSQQRMGQEALCLCRSMRNIVACNAMLVGYAQEGMGEEALRLYQSLQQEGLTPNCVTYVSLLQACSSVGVGALHDGKQLHAQIKERGLHEDVVLGGSLVNMYAKCGGLQDARSVFDKLPQRNVIAWTAMIAGYAQQGMGHESLGLYRSMVQEGLTPPNSVTYLCLLQACATV